MGNLEKAIEVIDEHFGHNEFTSAVRNVLTDAFCAYHDGQEPEPKKPPILRRCCDCNMFRGTPPCPRSSQDIATLEIPCDIFVPLPAPKLEAGCEVVTEDGERITVRVADGYRVYCSDGEAYWAVNLTVTKAAVPGLEDVVRLTYGTGVIRGMSNPDEPNVLYTVATSNGMYDETQTFERKDFTIIAKAM